jgi:hypothetical protein
MYGAVKRITQPVELLSNYMALVSHENAEGDSFGVFERDEGLVRDSCKFNVELLPFTGISLHKQY